MSTQKPTVDELVTQVRNLSGLRTNQQCTDIEIAGYLTDAGKELADLLIEKNQHYFTKAFDFSLSNDSTGAANGTNVIELPDDFQRADAVDCVDQPTQPYTVPMLGSWLERNSAAGPGLLGIVGAGRRYTVQGGDGQTQVLRMLPAFQAQGAYRLWYTPEYPALLTAPTPVPGTSGGVTGTFRSPSIDPTDHVNAAVNGTNTWTFAFGGFTQADVGAEMSPVGTPHDDGVYTIAQVLSPTVCVTNSQQSAGTFTSGNVVIASTTIPAVWSIPLAAFDSSFVGGFISVSGFSGIDAQLDNRIHRISAVLSATRILTVGTGVTSNSTSAATFLPYPALSRSDLPALLCPWSLYLVVHASIAVRTKRQQTTDELQAKLQQQVARVSKVAANKTSEVVQAPMARNRSRGTGYGYGGGNGW